MKNNAWSQLRLELIQFTYLLYFSTVVNLQNMYTVLYITVSNIIPVLITFLDRYWPTTHPYKKPVYPDAANYYPG
jgi:hypothetical protein